jgi:FMN-dependent NADH-azoreductase
VDRIYSFYINQAGGTYRSALFPGKRLALVTTQGNPDPESFQRVIRWFGGMLQGLGMEEAGKIVHVDSHEQPAWKDPVLLEKARQVGRRLALR